MLDFETYPIVAAIRTMEDFLNAIDTDIQTVFLLSAD